MTKNAFEHHWKCVTLWWKQACQLPNQAPRAWATTMYTLHTFRQQIKSCENFEEACRLAEQLVCEISEDGFDETLRWVVISDEFGLQKIAYADAAAKPTLTYTPWLHRGLVWFGPIGAAILTYTT